jgi:hypothetical protein
MGGGPNPGELVTLHRITARIDARMCQFLAGPGIITTRKDLLGLCRIALGSVCAGFNRPFIFYAY